MSFNITRWKTKKLENLIIPLKAFYGENVNTNWKPKAPNVVDIDLKQIEIECGCDQLIVGFLVDTNIEITELDLAGEGSGSLMYYIIKPALEQSTGELEATIVWEDGSISKMIVKDGIVTESDVEL